MPASFRARLRSGERLIAPLVTLNSPAVAELLAEVGFDWLFIDAEHSPLDTAQMQALMQGAGATPCVVRLSASDDLHVKRALDIGAAGIIAPQVNSVDHARRIVQAAKYAPAGQRGLGIARAHRYGLQVREYMQTANDDTAVIVQAEHRDALGADPRDRAGRWRRWGPDRTVKIFPPASDIPEPSITMRCGCDRARQRRVP